MSISEESRTNSFLEGIKERIKNLKKKIKIVYPDGEIDACREGAAILLKEGIITPVLLGNREMILKSAKEEGLNLEGAEIIDPAIDVREDYIDTYMEYRKHKGIDRTFAAAQMLKVNYYGTMMVEKGDAAGLVGGLTSATKPFIPAFEIIKTAEGINRASAIFFMVKEETMYMYSDCAITIDPDAQSLAEIGASSGDTAVALGITPRIAFLSFSTNNSGKGPLKEKMAEATRLCKELRPNYQIDGEMQFDAALLPDVAAKKFPNSKVPGNANIFIFPDLNAGNIGYKITERLGGFKAVGPIIQGLRKPVNDLSRGAAPGDIADTAYLTAIQSIDLLTK